MFHIWIFLRSGKKKIWKNYTNRTYSRPTERRPLAIMGALLRALPETPRTITVLWCRGALNGAPIMPRGVSQSDSQGAFFQCGCIFVFILFRKQDPNTLSVHLHPHKHVSASCQIQTNIIVLTVYWPNENSKHFRLVHNQMENINHDHILSIWRETKIFFFQCGCNSVARCFLLPLTAGKSHRTKKNAQTYLTWIGKHISRGQSETFFYTVK